LGVRINKNGKYLHISAIVDDDGNIADVSVIARDISDIVKSSCY
jgi:hypothetical protein